MKVSIVKIPSRYERVDVQKDINRVSDFLDRRGIRNTIEIDELGKHIIIHDGIDSNTIVIRTYDVIHICSSHVISVDSYSHEFTKLFDKLSKLRSEE